MESTTYIALSRQGVLRREMSMIAQNLANLETPAYRGESLMFVEYLAETQKGDSGELSFTQDIATIRDLQEGPMKRTENPLDLALSGPGYFAVEAEDGERYTRNGSFQLNDAGEIVTAAGAPVLDVNNNPIQVPPDAAVIEIARDGAVSTEEGQLAQLRLVAFEDEQALKKRADGLYETAEDQVPQAAEEVQVMQGMLEGSNVQGVIEMTRMIDVVRSYQGAGKFTEGEHERMLRAVRTLVSSN
jgi:flagellar basal-body rod protein FlgF